MTDYLIGLLLFVCLVQSQDTPRYVLDPYELEIGGRCAQYNCENQAIEQFTGRSTYINI